MKIKYKFIIIISSIILISTIFISASKDKNFEIFKNLEIINAIFRDLSIYHVEDPNISELAETAISAMLKKIDPYTIYYPENKIEEYYLITKSEYAGVGFALDIIEDNLVINNIIPNSPAQKANLFVGDIIIAIEGKKVSAENRQQITQLLIGEVNSELNIEIKRCNSEKTIVKKIKRTNIKINSVPYFTVLDNNIAYIKFTKFSQNSSIEFKKALQNLAENNKLKGLIIDMDDNPGGLLIEAVKISNFFIEKGQKIVSTKGRLEKFNFEYFTKAEALFKDLPIVIIVNKNSASASEIVSGAFQDLDRAVVIGSNTFGKGLVQITQNLKYNSKIKITTSKYYIPSGRCIQIKNYFGEQQKSNKIFKTKNGRIVYERGGIKPDIEVKKYNFSNFVQSLINNKIIFNFTTEFLFDNYYNKEKKYDDNIIFNEFIKYIEKRKINIYSAEYQLIDSLYQYLKENNSSNNSEKLLNIKTSLEQEKNQNINNNKTEILRAINKEISSRINNNNESVKFYLENSAIIDSAKMILTNKTYYKNILNY